tara:strand:- start:5899 stop:6063 length:165 start_codon:yes stop_codon:yes gene_type:complete
MNLPPFKQNLHYYFRYAAIGLIAVSLIFFSKPNAKFVLGIGIFLLALSFGKKNG